MFPPTITSITLQDVVPQALSHLPSGHSQVWHTSLTLRRGEYYCIESASGGGKSSLCSYIYGLRNDYQGSITFNSSTCALALSPEQWCALRREALALLPQDMRLFPHLTARENVDIKNSLTHALSSTEIEEMFNAFGLSQKIDTPCGRLSIGEQQRVAIIRTLSQKFDFILLDEPVSHLDPDNNDIAAELILGRASKLDAGIIATSVGNPINLPYTSTLRL